MKEVISALDALFGVGGDHGPCLVLIDNLHTICPFIQPDSLSAPSTIQSLHISHHLSSLIMKNRSYSNSQLVHVLVTCSPSIEAINPLLISSPIFFSHHLHISPPTHHDRSEILQSLLQSADCDVPFLKVALLPQMNSLLPSDLVLLSKKFMYLQRNVANEDDEPLSIFESILEDYTPLSLLGTSQSSSHSSKTKKTIRWEEDVAGYGEVINQLTSTLISPSIFKLLYSKIDSRPSKGVLLFGPPGYLVLLVI